jgi:hypothetical protein
MVRSRQVTCSCSNMSCDRINGAKPGYSLPAIIISAYTAAATSRWETPRVTSASPVSMARQEAVATRRT